MKTLKELFSIIWGKNSDMVDYCTNSNIWLNMGNYWLDVAPTKPIITKDLYYSDEVAPGVMAEDPGTGIKNFLSHNENNYPGGKWIKDIEEGNKDIILVDGYSHKGITELKSWTTKAYYYEELRENERKATEEEKAIIIKAVKAEDRKFTERLQKYYKRYGKHIRTVSYWANR